MAERYPGGVISKTPPVITGPTGGEGGSASGMWTLDTVLEYEKAGAWPKPILPRELYAWGNNGFGKLGLNDAISRSSPVQVGALTDWNSVTAGENFTAAIKTTGSLWSWGRNNLGQLASNSNVYRSSPVQVGALTNWSVVSTHPSGESVFTLKTDGTIWSWGNNFDGQLGHNDRINRSSPVQIGAISTWAFVVAGKNNGVAVKADGTLWTWGKNTGGQLGQNVYFTTARSSPVQVGSLTNWYIASVADDAVAAIKTDGTLWTWGSNGAGNEVGQLGQTTGYNANKSSPVQVGALTNWSKVSGGGAFFLATKTDGTLWSWGDNNSARLGLNDTNDRSSPTQVGALTNWSTPSASSSRSFAIKTDGSLWAWGNNGAGTSGVDDIVTRSSPIQVGSEVNWNFVSAGGHVMAITKG
jgi:alpha-tubulin suppressor-like RCC1 family protein